MKDSSGSDFVGEVWPGSVIASLGSWLLVRGRAESGQTDRLS